MHFIQYLCRLLTSKLTTMKKSVFLLVLVAMFVACNNHEPQPTKQVTFHIDAFRQSTTPMGIAPKQQATILDDQDGTALTDLYVFDCGTQLLHQTNDQEDFGTFTLNLTHGSHSLSFVLTRSTDISINGSTMTMGSVRPTFGKLLTLNVTSNTPAQDLMLDRISGQMVITITDEFPANADEIEFVINPRYSAIDVTTLCAINGSENSQRVSCASKVGKSNQSYTFNLLAPSITDEYTADVTINVYDSSNALIHAVLVEGVRLAANTKTLLSGKVFRGTDATLNVNHTWNTDIVGSF